MKLSDGGRSGRGDAVGGGSVTRSFLLTVGAGRGERRTGLDSGPPPARLPEQPSKWLMGGGQ